VIMSEILEANRRPEVWGMATSQCDAEGLATLGDVSARVGLPLETADGTTVLDLDTAREFTAQSVVETPQHRPGVAGEMKQPSRLDRILSTKTGKTAVAVIGGLTVFAASAMKPATAEAAYGFFGPKITTVEDATSFKDFSLKEDCSPLRDAMGKSVGIKDEATQRDVITPDRVEITGKTRAINDVYKKSTAADGCEAKPVPNVNPGSSTAYKYAVNIEGLSAKIRASIIKRTVRVSSNKEGEWRQPKNDLLRGECGLQVIEKKAKPPKKHHVTPVFRVPVKGHLVELIALAKAQSTAEQGVTLKCPDGATFSANQKAAAEAEALGAVADRIAGGKDVFIKKTDLDQGENSWAAVQIAFKRKAAAIIASVKSTADSSVSQNVTGDCGPGPQPSATPTATATASPSPSPTSTPSPSPTPPKPIVVVVEQKAPGFEGVNENDPYTVCAKVTSGDPKSWLFKLRYDSLDNPPDPDLDGDGIADIDGYDNPLEAKSRCVDLRAPNAVYNDDEVIVNVVSVDGSKASDTTGKYPIRQPAKSSSKPIIPSNFSFKLNTKAPGGLKV
jgi:hypothetical protein